MIEEKTVYAEAITEFPSGFHQMLGYRIMEWTDGAATLALTVGPRHLNRGGVLHSGVLATLIGTAGAYAGCYCPHAERARRVAAISLSVQFVAPPKSGAVLARAKVRGGAKKMYIASAEVHDTAGTLLAVGEVVYRYQAGSETTEGVPLGQEGGEKRNTSLG
ncbi:MAG: PaaI family thioesterase [Pseudomonadota bacterium]